MVVAGFSRSLEPIAANLIQRQTAERGFFGVDSELSVSPLESSNPKSKIGSAGGFVLSNSRATSCMTGITAVVGGGGGTEVCSVATNGVSAGLDHALLTSATTIVTSSCR